MTTLETELSAKLARSQEALASALEAMKQLTQENELLRQKVDLLTRRIFGAKSEKISPEQMELLLGWQEGEAVGKKPDAGGPAPAAEASEVSPAPRPRKPAKKRKPRSLEHLPKEVTVIDPPEVIAERSAWRCIGETTSEQLDFTPARFILRCTVRPKYVRLDHPYEAPVIALLPDRLLDRSLPAPGLLAHIQLADEPRRHLPG